MFEKLPSLLGFQPKFYVGGPSRFYLPLFYDLVASKRPKTIVLRGFGDGQTFFTFCQAVREQDIECQCVAVRRERAGETDAADLAWLKGKDYGDEFYGDFARFEIGPAALTGLADHSVDLLLLDDCDSGAEIRADLSTWESKLSPDGVVLFHGIGLERSDDPKAAWLEWTANRPTAEFPDGIGLGITLQSEAERSREPLFKALFAGKETIAQLGEVYRLAVARMEAQVRADEAGRAQAAFEARQIWLDSLLADRGKVQEIMDHQLRTIDSQTERLKQFENLLRDRARAQLVMDGQAEQLKHWTALAHQAEADRAKLKAQVQEQKQILKAAKSACRKKGRCFQLPGTAKKEKRRSLSERIVREIKRAPGNLLGRRKETEPESKAAPKGPQKSKSAGETVKPVDRYAAWIAEHEPRGEALDGQWAASQLWSTQPKISLLVPVLNTPAHFLEEMFSSVAEQTYRNWELCLVDAGSTAGETLQVLDKWVAREPRIRFERLAENLGIAENTNRALKLATGDYVGCLDHDDLLAPFALYEIARAISSSPATEIFYSDEDRWSENGRRHAPFFKPEWSPEFLYSCMYLGHLTVYRRDLTEALGGFRTAFDLSQDYDFALRATERASAVRHVPGVLYHWREHPGSGSAGGKPGARKTNLAALADAMKRRGLPAEIMEYPTANRVRFEILEWPKVSIIIPTDSAERSRVCMEQLPRMTSYSNYEIVIVTNTALAELLEVAAPMEPGFRFVRYDKPFNFSEKCNLGAQAAIGERLIFFNDDVESGQRDWIENLIEPLENPEVGAVAPKLLYATGKIQHAGLVTGVRGLVGTACHEWPGDSVDYANLAQSMRDVSALSAACLAIRRKDFFRVGEFDAVNTPIAHSDFDLCFKIREAGFRCVYTPFVTMTHRGHVSIGAAEQEGKEPRDKASTYLLRRWPRYTCHDPYYPDYMRDWLYMDSPTPIRMIARDQPALESYPELLFVSHDLTLSGAPILLLHLAEWCKRKDIFVVVMAPADGPLREKYEAAGIPLIIDPLIMTGHESFTKFARDFDCVVANTIRSEPAVRSAHSAKVPVIWWVHETGVGEHFLQQDAKLRSAVALADVVLAPSERTANVYRRFRKQSVKCFYYGIPDAGEGVQFSGNGQPRAFRFLVLGSLEPRKGQDVFLAAVSSLPPEMLQSAEFHLLGRVMDFEFGAGLEAAAAGLANVFLDGPCNHGEALAAIRRSDVLVCSSRDETMPVTILEALSLGKAVVSTDVGGIGEILTDGENALLVGPENPKALASAMRQLWKSPELVQQLGRNARATFERNFTQDQFGADFRQLVSEVMARETIHDPSSASDQDQSLYSDSSPATRMIAREQAAAGGSSPRLLFVSHDLSLSGAPMMLAHAVRWCRNNGIFVAVLSPRDGPLGDELKAEGIPLIVDPLLATGQESFVRFARNFDCVVANTIRSEPVVRAMLNKNLPIVWWLHEPGSVGEFFIKEDVKLRAALPLVDLVLVPSEQAAAVYRPFTTSPPKCLRNAIPDLRLKSNGKAEPLTRPRFLLIGSIEPRKGQDVFVEALGLLPREVQAAAEFQVAGRILDLDFWQKLRGVAAILPNFSVKGAVSHTEAIEMMTAADVIISASRDEAMPTVTILEAMCLGKALIATAIGGAREVLVQGQNSLLVGPEAPDQLAAAIRRCIEEPALVAELGGKARETYKMNFTMERFGKEFRESINGVISARTSGSSTRS